MQITTTKLTRAAGLAAVASGLLFTSIQIRHPEITLDFVTSTEWKIRQGMKVAMATLALVGVAGMYLRQIRRIGALGLIGYLLFSVGYLAMLCVEVIGMTVIPVIAHSSPEYVKGVIAVATNSSSTADLGLFGALNMLVAIGYILGGLVFGIALLRAGVLARWACALLAAAALATMAIPLLPMINQRLFALPNGIAMVGLGWSLWRKQRSSATESATPHARLDPAGAR